MSLGCEILRKEDAFSFLSRRKLIWPHTVAWQLFDSRSPCHWKQNKKKPFSGSVKWTCPKEKQSRTFLISFRYTAVRFLRVLPGRISLQFFFFWFFPFTFTWETAGAVGASGRVTEGGMWVRRPPHGKGENTFTSRGSPPPFSFFEQQTANQHDCRAPSKSSSHPLSLSLSFFLAHPVGGNTKLVELDEWRYCCCCSSSRLQVLFHQQRDDPVQQPTLHQSQSTLEHHSGGSHSLSLCKNTLWPSPSAPFPVRKLFFYFAQSPVMASPYQSG